MTGQPWSSDDVETVAASFAALRASKTPDTQPMPPTCKCGALDHHLTERDVVDMSTAAGHFALTKTPIRRTCRACDHNILSGRACVTHRPLPGHAVFNAYHPECIDLGGRHD